ncbi:MAG: hypothetical protein AB8B86_03535 [Pseudomonadales bacterium]
MKTLSTLLFTLAVFQALAVPVAAQSEEDRVKNYIEQQKAAGIAPKSGSPHWKPGFTCNDLKQFSFAAYQECRYFYAVHGRYYKN